MSSDMSSSRSIITLSLLALAIVAPTRSSAGEDEALQRHVSDHLSQVLEARASASIASRIESSLYAIDYSDYGARARTLAASTSRELSLPPASPSSITTPSTREYDSPAASLATEMRCFASRRYSLSCTVSMRPSKFELLLIPLFHPSR
jgi:hypothetical protein